MQFLHCYCCLQRLLFQFCSAMFNFLFRCIPLIINTTKKNVFFFLCQILSQKFEFLHCYCCYQVYCSNFWLRRSFSQSDLFCEYWKHQKERCLFLFAKYDFQWGRFCLHLDFWRLLNYCRSKDVHVQQMQQNNTIWVGAVYVNKRSTHKKNLKKTFKFLKTGVRCGSTADKKTHKL